MDDDVFCFAPKSSIILVKMLLEFIANNFKGGIEGFNKFFTDLKTIVLVTLLTVCLSYYQAKDKFDDTIIDKETYPVEACNYILKNIDLGINALI